MMYAPSPTMEEPTAAIWAAADFLVSYSNADYNKLQFYIIYSKSKIIKSFNDIKSKEKFVLLLEWYFVEV